MSTRAGAAMPLAPEDPVLTSAQPTGLSAGTDRHGTPGQTNDVAATGRPAPPPITTRWAPAQRLGVPPVRRRPVSTGSLVAVGAGTTAVPIDGAPVQADAANAASGETGTVGSHDRGPGRVLPLEDETTRRVIAQTRAVGQAVLEVLTGARPAGQLMRWMDPAVHESLVLRAELVRASALRAEQTRSGPGRLGTVDGQRPLFRRAAVRSVHACRVSARCYEMSLVIGEPGGRSRAMALRLELRHLQWRVTALELG
ncbi:Rv3235 family protein [Tersicoccus sp. MR15.9]|uniref:Rv3235 family protein n=1 Tax=Tersicoccus mangrovi TaxID=3121635 RepID=UPI002FE64BCF